MSLDIGFRSYSHGFDEGVRPSDLRTLLYSSVRLGAVSLKDAATAEAVIASLCGGAGFAVHAASVAGVDRIAVVRSTSSGARGSIMHAFLILDAKPAHRGDWIAGDVHGTRTLGDAAGTWAREGGSIRVEAAPAEAPGQADAALVGAVMRRLPWLAGVAGEHALAGFHAVADLVRIARIVQRCPMESIGERVRELDEAWALHDPMPADGPLPFGDAACRHGAASDGRDAGTDAPRFKP